MSSSKLYLGYGRTGYSVTKHFDGPVPMDALTNDLFAWSVYSLPLYADVYGQQVEIPGKSVNVRSDNAAILGVPSSKYAIHQYQDSLLKGVENILGGGLAVNAAGYTGNGRRAWVSVSLADTVTTAEGVEFLPHLIAYGSHDSTLPTGYKRSALNMVCNNMIGKMLREKSQFSEVKVKHTVNSAFHLESAQQALGILAETEDDFSRQIRELCEQEVLATQWDDFVTAYVPIGEGPRTGGTVAAEEKRENLHALYKHDERCAPWAGTAWGVVQTVNTWERWESNVRKGERDERNQDRDLTDFWNELDRSTLGTLNRVLVGA